MLPSADSTDTPTASGEPGAPGAPEPGSNPSSPPSKVPEPKPLPISLPQTKPKPLPKWLHLRIKASTLFSRSRRLGTSNVIVLPFNKIAKLDVPANEIAAMRFVRANTTIPVPEILEVHDSQEDGTAHIVMSYVPGEDLEDALHKMTDGEVRSVVKELAGYLQQLRRLESDGSGSDGSGGDKHPHPIGGASGTPGFDIRLGSSPWGPFTTAADFHTHVRLGEPLSYWSHEPDVTAVHARAEEGGGSARAYGVRFTHGDVAPRNVRVRRGRVTGLIDWEFAGWYPEYWEYTRMFYPGERPYLRRWFDAVEGEEGIEKYRQERRAEEAIWARAGPFGYG